MQNLPMKARHIWKEFDEQNNIGHDSVGWRKIDPAMRLHQLLLS